MKNYRTIDRTLTEIRDFGIRFILIALIFIFGPAFLGVGSLTIAQGSDSPRLKETDRKTDNNLRSVAKVNPSTLAMEMSIPLMVYPGRGNSVPVGISYSSKVWRMSKGLTYFYTLGTSEERQYVTWLNPLFAEASSAGWSSSLARPVIEEKLVLYNQYGDLFAMGGPASWADATFQYALASSQNVTPGAGGSQCGDCSYNYGFCSPSCSICSGYCNNWCTYTGGFGVGCPNYPGTGGGGTSSPTPTPIPTPCNPANQQCPSPTPTPSPTPFPTPTPAPEPIPPGPIVAGDRMYYVKRVNVRMADGSTREFRKSDSVFGYCLGTNYDGLGCEVVGLPDNRGTYLSVDGSGSRLVRDEDGSTLFFRDGSKYSFTNEPQPGHEGTSVYPAIKSTDRNGNTTLLTESQVNGKKVVTTVDTVGREISDFLPENFSRQETQEGNKIVSLPGFDGQTHNFQLRWRHLKPVPCTGEITENCGSEEGALENPNENVYFYSATFCSGNNYSPVDPNNTFPSEKLFPNNGYGLRTCNPFTTNEQAQLIGSRFNPVVLAAVELPNGQMYEFKYNQYAEITKVIYPSNAFERFIYSNIQPLNGFSEMAYDQVNRGVIDHLVYDSNGSLVTRTKYAAGYESGTGRYVVTSVVPKQDTTVNVGEMVEGIKTVRFLVSTDGESGKFGFQDVRSGMPVEERTYDENGNLRSRSMTYFDFKSVVSGSLENPMIVDAQRDLRSPLKATILFDKSPATADALATFSKTEFDDNVSNDPEYFSHLNQTRSSGYHYAVVQRSAVDDEPLDWATVEGWFSGKLAAVTETDYSYDPNYKDRGIIGLPIRTRSLDPANPNPNTPLAKTETIYDNALPNSASGYVYAIQTYGTSNAFDCATASPAKICWENPNGPGGNIDLSYRGLPTTSRVWDAANNEWIETRTQYDQFGNAVKTRDPIGNEITTEFGAENKYAYPTHVITPAPGNGNNGTDLPSHSYTSYDFITGLPLTTTDDFGQTMATEYNDPLLRPTRAFAVNFTAPESQTIYDDTNRTVKVRKQIDQSNWDEATTFMDSLGRTIKTVAKDSQGDVIVETHYDSLGRVDRVTNPYRAGDTVYWSKTRYDELGRAVETFAPAELENLSNAQSLGVTSFGISSVLNYVGTVVTTTDASGRKGRSITNGLGQLVRVDEPVAAGGTADADLGSLDSPAQPTIYKYDVFGKMVEVIQGVQHRYFKYDALGRLLRVRQPEQEINPNLATSGNPGNDAWTAGFAYDPIGNVVRATDANGVNIINEYDKAGRVVKRCYTKPNINTTATACAQIASGDVSIDTPAVSFWYDGKGLAQVQTPHNFAKGKLTMVTSSVSETQNTLFDNFGRITESKQITDGNTYTSRYTYNFAGALVEEEYPSGRKVKNEFETDGDLARVTSAKNAASVFAQYVSNFSYTASGGISQMRLGNGRWETAKFNPRLQVKELGLGASATDTGLWKVGFEYGELDANGNIDEGKNTGNIARQTLAVPGTSFVQSYKYDSLYRIREAKETTGSNTNWIQNWDYDRYGNRIGFTQNIAGITTAPNPSIDTDSNRFNLNQGFSYDKNGNVVRDVDPVTNHVRDFVFNGDNKQSQVKDVTNGNLVVGTYYYDGEGKRVKKVTDTETTIFVYSSGKLIAEYSTQISQTPAVAYTTTDHLGSPRVITDATGQVTSRRDFMPFGEDLNAGVGNRTGGAGLKYSMPGDNIRQKFTGYERDIESELDFAQARYYNNQHGRFTSTDPLLSTGEPDDPQTWNRYVYALNSPLYYTDPTGLYVCKGNEEQCKQFAARLAEGKEYLKKVGDKYGVDSDKYKQVSNALNAYGEDETGKDKNNGVFVSFDRKKGGGNTEGTFDKDGKLTGINVSLNASDLKNKNSFHAVVGHEGDHVNYFQTVGNNTNDKRNFEYGGHFVQSLLGEAQFGQFANGRYWATDDNAKQYDIWNSSWEGPDRETLRTSAINKWLDVPTNQGGYGPNPPPPPKPKPTRQRRKKG